MNKQAGNALFLILIAVALFAALSYAVTQSGRGSANIDKDKANLLGAQISQYGSQMENAVTRMRLINGCSDLELSFENAATGTTYQNATAPTECELFNPVGGGMTYDFPDEASTDTDWIFTGSMTIVDVGYDPGGHPADAKEIIALMRNIDEDVCVAINRSLGIKSGLPVPEDTRVTTTAYTGSFVSGGYGLADDVDSAILAGHYSGCVESAYPSPGVLFYYHVIAPR
jgi:hypothetical protein